MEPEQQGEGSGGSSRTWCFRLYAACDKETDLSEDERGAREDEIFTLLGAVDAQGGRYIIFSLERTETQRLHYQGYVEWATPTRFARCKLLLGFDSVHVEKRIKTRSEAREYCRKEDSHVDGPWEAGRWIGHQDAPCHLTECIHMLRDGANMVEVADFAPAVWARNHNALRIYQSWCARGRDPEVPSRVVVFFGPPGVGKTRFAWHDLHFLGKPYFNKSSGDRWFDGYAGEQHMLIDDFEPDVGGIRYWLRVFDRYPMPVAIKGGFVQLRTTLIYITSNVHPSEWFPEALPVHQLALKRRIEIIDMTYEMRLYGDPDPYEVPGTKQYIW